MKLRKPCEHGRYDEHGFSPYGKPSSHRPIECPGGEFPDPAGFLVYGEFIPYDIWIKNLPFAAPVDQVVALFAANQAGEPS